MTQATTGFTQREFISRHALLQNLHASGVCSALVSEWLAAGGSREASTFGTRGRRGGSSDLRTARNMDAGRGAMLRDNGLATDATLAETSDLDAALGFIEQPGLYYFKICLSGNQGHALGISTKSGRMRLFDPNGKEAETGSVQELQAELLRLLVAYGNRTGVTGYEVVRVKPMFGAR